MTRRDFVASTAAAIPLGAAGKSEFRVYAGTYTRKGGKSKGIYALTFDAANGKLSNAELVAETRDPSFLTIHPNRKYLYAVDESADPKKGVGLSAFEMDAATGKLKKLNEVSSRGTSPCHLLVDHTGKNVVLANYGSGSVAAFPLEADGRLKEAASFIQHEGSSIDPRRQKGPHAHSVNITPDNRFIFVADLGLDQVKVYKLDAAKCQLSPNDPPFAKVHPGGGPRHFNLHPSLKYAYSNSEMGNAVTAFSFDKAKGALTEIQYISTLPAGWKGVSHTAEVLCHPTGKFLYCSNRGHDSIAVFTIGKDGKLTTVEQTPTQGKTPRNFNIDPTGRYLLAANQDSDNIVVFSIDQKTGKLKPTGQSVEVGAPVCLKFLRV
ncbi:MAG: lactonase family protein [Bryobacterales bacterium]|nr:lactonase family protein [Bryobacterales bacterium]